MKPPETPQVCPRGSFLHPRHTAPFVRNRGRAGAGARQAAGDDARYPRERKGGKATRHLNITVGVFERKK